jgi:hypothetical protein
VANKIELEQSQAQSTKREEALPEENPQLEAELIEGFLAKQASEENTFVGMLRPYLRREIRRSHPGLWRSADDLEQSALLRLYELRASQAERIRAPCRQLAVFVVDEAAHVVHRSVEWSEPPEDDGGDRRDSIPLGKLVELFAIKLDADDAEILLLHAAYMAGDGPPVHEALGITKKRARRQLLKAQDALLDVAGGNDELPEEDEESDE